MSTGHGGPLFARTELRPFKNLATQTIEAWSLVKDCTRLVARLRTCYVSIKGSEKEGGLLASCEASHQSTSSERPLLGRFTGGSNGQG